MNQFNYVKWGFVVALVGSAGTVLTVPEIRCSIGLLSETCAASQKEIEMIAQTETGEALPGVKVQVIAKGAPENQLTDTNGYAKVRIASQGDVRISLTKSGYPTQDFNINLANDQNTVRVIRLAQSGQPVVNSSSTAPSASGSPTPVSQAQTISTISWDVTGSDLTGKVGQDFKYMCPPNGTVGRVWGTDIYTIGSSICSAAVHAGLINARDGGTVQIKVRSGESFYNGTTRNGVSSNRYGSYPGSFTFLNSTGIPIATEQIQSLDWNDTASNLRGKLDQDFTYTCPPNGTLGNIWGTDLYTISSSICSAAVHAGTINAKDGGKVQIRIRPGESFYNGTTRNGITSNRYGNYSWSFTIVR
jgi:hypothetical protein